MAIRYHLDSLTALRLQRDVEHLHHLGPRATTEFILDLTDKIGGRPAALSLLAEYRQRLDAGASRPVRAAVRGMWRHGLWSIEAVERRRQTTAEMRELRLLIRSLREE